MAFPDFIRTSVGKNIRARVTGHSLKGLNGSGTSVSHKQQTSTQRTSFQNPPVLKQSHLQSHALTDLPNDHPQHIKRRGRALAAPGVAAPAREAVTSRSSTDSDDAEDDHFDASRVTQLAAQLSSGAANGSMPPLDSVPISQILAPVQVRVPTGLPADVVLRRNCPLLHKDRQDGGVMQAGNTCGLSVTAVVRLWGGYACLYAAWACSRAVALPLLQLHVTA